MTEPASARQEDENCAVLRVSSGPLAAPVLARVVAMMLARAGCPIDRLEEALTLCDAVSAHAPDHAADGHVRFTVLTHPDALELRVGALARDGARELLEQASLPGVGNLLEPIADDLRIEAASGDGAEELVLSLSFSQATA